MRRTAVSSSNLASVGYDADQRILEIEFLNRSVYQYYNVPESLYRSLMNASSHGSYFDSYIKRGGFSYRRIR